MVIALPETFGDYALPINFIFWAFVFVYCIHILEETVVPEVFVEKVKRKYWSNYTWQKFFGFNTILLLLNISSVILFETYGKWLIVLPLMFCAERVFNGIYHIVETIISKQYSSGLLSSVMTWILEYLLIRYCFLKGQIPLNYIIVSTIIGIAIGSLMIFPLISGKFSKIK